MTQRIVSSVGELKMNEGRLWLQPAFSGDRLPAPLIATARLLTLILLSMSASPIQTTQGSHQHQMPKTRRHLGILIVPETRR
jgi:hypothetical protein